MKEFLYFLVGPTATGKSEIGVALARRMGAEILSLDSMQVYSGMDIGTAKIPVEKRGAIPHHLLDLLPPSWPFSVADYREEAEKKIREIRGRKKKPLFVGGTPLYLKVLTHGLFEGASMSPEIRKRLTERAEKEGHETLHRELQRVDPAAAAKIHPNDQKRVIRALEVFQLTGSPISELQKEWAEPKGEPSHRIAGLRLPKEVLHQRIEQRIQNMFAAGWVGEVQNILQSGGFGPQSSKALGYREILDHIQRKTSLEETQALIVKKTRIFARRQMTWLRSFPEILWVDVQGGEPPEEVTEEVLRKLTG